MDVKAYMDRKLYKEQARRLLEPLVSSLASLGVSPMLVSLFGLVFSLYGAFLLAKGSLFWAGIWLIISGLADSIDGALARRRGVENNFGAFVDSTFDRISEFAYFSGLLIYYVNRPQGFGLFIIILICIALSASVLISYTRARLEGLGYSCTVGWMERPERLTLLVVGLLLGSRVLAVALFLLAVGATITLLQRIRYAQVVTEEDTSPTE